MQSTTAPGGAICASTATSRASRSSRRSLSGRGVDSKFALLPDDHALTADGADTTRVVLRVTDEFGAIRTYANDPIAFTLRARRS